MTLSVYRKDLVILGLLSSILFGAIALPSFNIEKSYCDINSTDNWVCHEETHQDSALGYLFGGLSVFMLFFSIIMAIVWTGEEIKEAGYK